MKRPDVVSSLVASVGMATMLMVSIVGLPFAVLAEVAAPHVAKIVGVGTQNSWVWHLYVAEGVLLAAFIYWALSTAPAHRRVRRMRPKPAVP